MNLFVNATTAPAPKTKNIRIISTTFAAILILIVGAQLFTFEKFPDVIKEFWLPGGEVVSSFLAAFIVTLEVAALPFLLSMRLSPLMRITSVIAGWLVVLVWFIFLLWQNIVTFPIANNGLLGATIPLPVGWWSVMVWLAVSVLAVWSAWGIWPFAISSKQKNRNIDDHLT